MGDIETINTELILADLQTVEQRLPRLAREAKGDAALRPTVDAVTVAEGVLGDGRTIAEAAAKGEVDAALLPRSASADGEALHLRVQRRRGRPGRCRPGRPPDRERPARSGHRPVRTDRGRGGGPRRRRCGRAVTQLRAGGVGARATGPRGIRHPWAADVPDGGTEGSARHGPSTRATPPPKAAGVIHTDFERGFIKAEVISFDDLMEAGSVAAARTAGRARMEGKDYVMRDGDVVEFRFNT